MIRALALAAALIALSGAPVASLDVGAKIGPVLMNPGGTICDTPEQAIRAIEATGFVEGCGYLTKAMPVVMEVVDHFEGERGAYAILRILFVTLTVLGVQYGWVPDGPEDVGV